MQLGMQRIIQFSSRLTRRRYDTCAIRLVAPASNEPYIQYRACKRKKLNKHNISNNIHSNVISNVDNRGVDGKVHRNAGRDARDNASLSTKARWCQRDVHNNASMCMRMQVTCMIKQNKRKPGYMFVTKQRARKCAFRRGRLDRGLRFTSRRGYNMFKRIYLTFDE